MSETPPGWLAVGAIAMVTTLMVSATFFLGALAVVVTAWTGTTAIAIRRRNQAGASGMSLADLRDTRYDFAVGQRVFILADGMLYGTPGTLVKPTRWLGDRAWLVELDLGRTDRLRVRRTRVAERALVPASLVSARLADPGMRRAVSARRYFMTFLPFAASVWAIFRWQVALGFDVVLARAWVTASRTWRR